MLKIFKDYVSKTSILDDFIFYEGRQKAMQEKRARQQVQQQQRQASTKKYFFVNHVKLNFYAVLVTDILGCGFTSGFSISTWK